MTMKEEDVFAAIRRELWRVLLLLGLFNFVVLGIAFGILAATVTTRMNSYEQWMLASERRLTDTEHTVGDVLPRVERVLNRVSERIDEEDRSP